MKSYKKLYTFNKYQSLKKIFQLKKNVNVCKYKRKQGCLIQQNRKVRVLKKKFFHAISLIHKFSFSSFILFMNTFKKKVLLRKTQKKNWFLKCQVFVLLILFKNFIHQIKFEFDLEKFCLKKRKNYLRILKIHFLFFFGTKNPTLDLHPFLFFEKYFSFKYNRKIFKQKRKQPFLHLGKVFISCEIRNIIHFIKFYKRNFISFFKIKNLLWKNFAVKKTFLSFFFKCLKKMKILSHINSLYKKNLLKPFKFVFFVQLSSTLFCKNKKNRVLLKKERFYFIKKNNSINLDKIFLINVFFYKKEQNVFFYKNWKTLKFFSTLTKLSNLFKPQKKENFLLKVHFEKLNVYKLLNQKVKNQLKKFCFYGFLSNPIFVEKKIFQQIYFYSLNKKKIFLFEKKANYKTNCLLKKESFKLNFIFSNFQEIFLNNYFCCFYQNNFFSQKREKKEKLKFYKFRKWVEKNWSKSRIFAQMFKKSKNLPFLLLFSQKDTLFIKYSSNIFFIKIFFEEFLTFLLNSSKLCLKPKAIGKREFYELKIFLKNFKKYKKEISLNGFSIFQIQSDFIVKDKLFKRKDFLLKRIYTSFLYKQNEIFFLPSKKQIKNHLKKLKKILFKNFSQNQKILLLKLKFQIFDWCYKYRIIKRKDLLFYCDKILNGILWKWACCIHKNKSKQWIKRKYFMLFHKNKRLFGIFPNTFSFKQNFQRIVYLPNHSQIAIWNS